MQTALFRVGFEVKSILGHMPAHFHLVCRISVKPVELLRRDRVTNELKLFFMYYISRINDFIFCLMTSTHLTSFFYFLTVVKSTC